MDKRITKPEDMDDLEGDILVVESGEILDIANIRFGFDGVALTLRPVELLGNGIDDDGREYVGYLIEGEPKYFNSDDMSPRPDCE